jgi:dipeptidyl-peptidase-4
LSATFQPPAVARLREVPLWFSPEYRGTRGRAEYHPDAEWLKENGRNPAMAKGVEVTDTRHFEREMKRMPNFMLHELAHSYHDRVLGFEQPDIIAAYEHAKAAKLYNRVERSWGDGRPNTFERAYAMTDHKEYFAENTEAFFSRNDFFPFTRGELKKHDLQMFKVLERVWGTTRAASPPPGR